MAELRRLRVLLLLHELSLTGAPRSALRIFTALGAQVDLRVVTRERGPLMEQFARLGPVSILNLHTPDLARDPIAWIRRQVIRARIMRWRPDLQYANSVLTLPIARRLAIGDVPILLHVHESTVALGVFETAYPELIRSMPSGYVAVSETVSEALATGFNVPKDQIRVIPPFVEMSQFAGAKRNREGEASSLLVGGMGNPSWTKGLTLWLLMAREIADRSPELDVRFRWVGIRETAEGHQFRAMARKLGLESVVEFVPEVEDASNELAQFDILAITSWEEAASLVALEAMVAGVPVVCFRGSGGPPELLLDCGVIIPTFSPLSMAGAVIEMLEQPQRRLALATAAQARVSASYTVAATVPRIADEMTRLARSPRNKS